MSRSPINHHFACLRIAIRQYIEEYKEKRAKYLYRFVYILKHETEKGQAFGGYLNRAVISATCEMVSTLIDDRVDR